MRVLVHLYSPLCRVDASVLVDAETQAQARERAIAQAASADWEVLRAPDPEKIFVEGVDEWREA